MIYNGTTSETGIPKRWHHLFQTDTKQCCFHSLDCSVFPWRWGWGSPGSKTLPKASGLYQLNPGVPLLQGMESVKLANADASVAGMGISASARQRPLSTVSTPRARCAAGEARVCAADASAPTPGASAASANTAPPATQPAVTTGTRFLSPVYTKQSFSTAGFVLYYPFLKIHDSDKLFHHAQKVIE